MVFFTKSKLGEILLQEGIITEEQLSDVLSQQKISGERLGRILIEEGYLTEELLMEILGKQLDIPHVSLSNIKIDSEVVTSIPVDLAQRHKIIPLEKVDNLLTLAMSDPLNIAALDIVTMVTGCEVKPVIACESGISRLIDQYFGLKESMEKAAVDIQYSSRKGEDIDDNKIKEYVDEAPIVRVVNSIVQQALSEGASDIHIEPYDQGLKIRLRIDGILHDHMTTSKNIRPLIISRIKIMANMDISEKRLPQDGRIAFPLAGSSVNMRVSTLPTIFGEKIVMRILDKDKIIIPLDKLGLNQLNFNQYQRLIKGASGIILVTGPTGCGIKLRHITA